MLLRCSRERPAKGFSRMQGIPVGHGADLLARLLAFDPSRRLSVEAALQHPYLESFASGQVDRAKDVKPADVSYDTNMTGLAKVERPLLQPSFQECYARRLLRPDDHSAVSQLKRAECRSGRLPLKVSARSHGPRRNRGEKDGQRWQPVAAIRRFT